MENIQKERIYKFDNIKLFTMILVVLGHVIETPYVNDNKSELLSSLFIFIYSFHMPLFIFISGLFQKRFSDTNKLKINKVAYFVTLGFILKFLMAAVKAIGDKPFSVDIFGSSGIDWYLFVLAMYMVTAYLTRKVHPAVMITVSLLAGMFCGYLDFVDDTLYLSRYFVFLPIYLIGYYLTPQSLIKFEQKAAVKIISATGALMYFVLCFRNLQLVYKLRRLFTGKNPFSNVTAIEGCGFEHRLLCYLISAVLCIAVFCFIPNIKIPVLSNMGSNTLSVYIYHNAILYALRATAFFDIINSLGDPLYKIVLLFFAVILALVLSFGIFMVPLNMLAKGINKLKTSWCYVIIFAPFVLGLVAMYKELPGYFEYLINKVKNIFA